MTKMFFPTATEPAEQLVEILSFYEGETLLVSINAKDDLSAEFVIPEMILATNEMGEFSNIFEIQSDSVGKHPSLRLNMNRILNIKRIFHTEEITWRKDAIEINCENGIEFTVNILE